MPLVGVASVVRPAVAYNRAFLIRKPRLPSMEKEERRSTDIAMVFRCYAWTEATVNFKMGGALPPHRPALISLPVAVR